ncbi:hypothetical protein CRI94_12980 [Longibacter salinarum]|uniref:Uncharacterized protein n=1 Tax=Longibacter salinarum TaxID=1850348 RepID=A0A2A8CWC5_9BACT|nr:hypothetical protein CRI94_12980 [Longibacter salinarum]
MDFSGLDAFWSVADTLAASRPLDERDWRLLFTSPGYHMLSGRYPLRYPIVEAMKLTFDPRRTDERESVERSTVWMRPRMIRHFRRVKAHREDLETYRQTLARDDSLVVDVMRTLQPHLPEGALTDRYPPRITFLLFLDDGYASPDVVAIDLWMAYSMGRDALVRFIAHELFHSYRSSISRQRTDRDNGHVTMLVGALEQLENEGIADRIDKPAMLTRDLPLGTPLGDYSQDYRMAYADAPTVIAEIDRLLAQLEQRQQFSPGTVRQIQRAIPMGGHPTGAFMADVIADQSSASALRKTVGRVFSFLRAYHRAAKSHPSAPSFSDDALSMIDRLDAWTSEDR